MPAWTEEYLAALAARDHVEKANQHVYDAYTRLADRIGQSQGQHERQPAQGASANAGPSGAKQTPFITFY
ncbi:hypothetical protein KEM56_004263 [Ascosphaera pollenicola]|nr:hypothetical protein KEM56_004263 [Ascosphaera pollenicola]